MFRNKVLALIAGLCLVFPVAITEARHPNGNSHNRKGSTNSNYLKRKPFAALFEAISINSELIAEIQSQMSGMTENFAELEQRILAKEDDISAFESEANGVARTLTGAMDTLASLQFDLVVLQNDVAANQDEIEAFEALIVEVKSEIEVNSAEMAKLLNELRQELDVQKAGLGAFKEEFALYKAGSDLVITRLQNEMTNAICDIAATETVTGENLAAILLLQEEVNNINSDLIALNSSYISLCHRFNEHTHIYYDKWHIIYGIFRVTGRAQ